MLFGTNSHRQTMFKISPTHLLSVVDFLMGKNCSETSDRYSSFAFPPGPAPRASRVLWASMARAGPVSGAQPMSAANALAVANALGVSAATQPSSTWVPLPRAYRVAGTLLGSVGLVMTSLCKCYCSSGVYFKNSW